MKLWHLFALLFFVVMSVNLVLSLIWIRQIECSAIGGLYVHTLKGGKCVDPETLKEMT